MNNSVHDRGRVVPGAASHRTEQGPVYAPGISAETVQSATLYLGRITLPPGERTKAHVHDRHESAFYLLSGDQVELWSGETLQHREVAHPGDFLYIPANVPHVAVNRSATVPAVFIGARNEPTAHESMVLLPRLDPRVP